MQRSSFVEFKHVPVLQVGSARQHTGRTSRREWDVLQIGAEANSRGSYYKTPYEPGLLVIWHIGHTTLI
jgi:hypothetical protein